MGASIVIPVSSERAFAFLRCARRDRTLSPMAFRVLSAIFEESRFGAKQPAVCANKLAAMAGTTLSTAKRAVAELVARGLVVVQSGRAVRKAARYSLVWSRYDQALANLERGPEVRAQGKRPARPKDGAGRFVGAAGFVGFDPAQPLPKLSSEALSTGRLRRALSS